MSNRNRLVILSGPSCVGKSPLDRALKRLYPALREKLQPLVLYNSRDPRPCETHGIDYHFRSGEEIINLEKNPQYVVMDVRGDLQALDLDNLHTLLEQGDVFFEGNPFVGKTLVTHPSLEKVNKLSVFMSPLSRDELEYLQSPGLHVSLPDLVTDVMRRKLLRRTRRQKGDLSQKDLENIEKRAGSAYKELKEAPNFQYVLPNHDGEDSENWDAFYHLLGDARKVTLAFVQLLEGKVPGLAELWSDKLLP